MAYNDTDLIAQGTVVTVALQFTTFYDMGVLVFNASDLQPYLTIVALDNAAVILASKNTQGDLSMASAVEEIDISGSSSYDITAGQLRAQVLQAVANYNASFLRVFTLKTPSVIIGAGPASPLAPPPGPSGVQSLTDLVNSASGFVLVILLAVGVYFVVKVVRK